MLRPISFNDTIATTVATVCSFIRTGEANDITDSLFEASVRGLPICKRCPLVLHKVHKAELSGIRGKELEKVFKRARKA